MIGRLLWGSLCSSPHALMYYPYLIAKPSYLMSILCHLKGPLRFSSKFEVVMCGLSSKDVYQCAFCLYESLEQLDFGILLWLNVN